MDAEDVLRELTKLFSDEDPVTVDGQETTARDFLGLLPYSTRVDHHQVSYRSVGKRWVLGTWKSMISDRKKGMSKL